MDKISIKKKDDALTILLASNLGIQEAIELRDSLIDAIKGSRRIEIIMEQLESIDLSCLQVLCSAHSSAATSGIEIILKETIPQPIRSIIEDSAFENEPLFSRGGM